MRLLKHLAITLALLILVLPVGAVPAREVQKSLRDTVSVADSSYNYGIAVRTNLLWWGAAEPNLSVDIPMSDHVTVGVSGGIKTWPRFLPWDTDIKENTTQWRNFAIVPGMRYWFDETYDGFFLGADLLWTHFNVGNVKFPFGLYPEVREERLQGNFWGAGLAAGYSWWLGNRWRLELEGGAAVGYVDATRYPCAHCGKALGDRKGLGVVPKLGVNIAYNTRPRRPEPEPLPAPPVVIPAPPQAVPEPAPFIFSIPNVADYMGKAGDLLPNHPVLQPSSQYRAYTPDRILRKEEGALYVFFELDKSLLKRSFAEGGYSRDNGPVLDEILDLTRQIMADTTSRVSCIQIIGLASVEGSVKHNQKLSRDRAVALQNYIQERLPLKDDMFELIAGGEAWTELRDQVCDMIAEGGSDALSVADLEQVIKVIDTVEDVNQRENKLKSLAGGRIWKVLLPTVLHDQRNSGYVRIYFDYVPDEGARAINDAISDFETGNVQSALEKLEQLRSDNRSDQAYATALLSVGRETEAVEVLETAVARGDEGCKALLADWKKYSAERAAHEQYLRAIEEYNNLK